MKIIDVRENTKIDCIFFKFGDHEDEVVHLASPDSINIGDSQVGVIEINKDDINALIKALQLAKKEYFGE